MNFLPNISTNYFQPRSESGVKEKVTSNKRGDKVHREDVSDMFTGFRPYLLNILTNVTIKPVY